MKLGHVINDSRKKYPELTDELLENLQKWAQERGFPKIPIEQLALFAHSCYFELEASKKCMDIYYRMRSTVPEFFSNRDSRLQYLQHSLNALAFTALPKPDQNGNQIIFHRLEDPRPSEYMFNDGIKLLLMSIDVNLYTEGCSPGYIFLFDMQNVRLGHLTRLSVNSIRKFFEYIQDAMPVRLKAIHVLNAVWFMNKVLTLIKPFMRRELYETLHLYTGDVSDVHSYISPTCLPKDYGGELDYIENLRQTHSMKLDQLRDYFLEEEALFHNYSSDKAKTPNNESMRRTIQIANDNQNGSDDS